MAGDVPQTQPRAVTLAWGAQADPLTIAASLSGYTTGFILAWGDGLTDQVVPNQPFRHEYPAPGEYMLTAWRLNFVGLLAKAQVVVREKSEPQVRFEMDPTNPYVLRCVFQDDGTGVVSRHSITWPDTPRYTVWGVPGQHEYALFNPGSYAVTVRDEGTKRSKRFDVTVPAPEYFPDVEVIKDASDPTGWTAKVTVTKIASDGEGKDMAVSWGDGYADTVTAVQVGSTVSHQYAEQDAPDGQVILDVAYTDGSSPRYNGKIIKLPFGDA